MNEDRQLKIIQDFSLAYRKSWALFSAIEIDLFDHLRETPQTADQLADNIKVSSSKLPALLDLLVYYGWLVRHESAYAVHPDWLGLTDPERPDNLQAHLAHAVRTARSWPRIADVLKADAPVRRLGPPEAPNEDEHITAFHRSLGVRGYNLMQSIAESIPLKSGGRILDVGGGFGDLSRPLLERDPAATAVLADSPRTVELAREYHQTLGLADRFDYAPGDFMEDDLPGGFDLILLSSILHIYNRNENLSLLSRLHAAAAPGGAILVREITIDDARRGPESGLQFSLHMAINTETGKAYSPKETRTLLKSAGWNSLQTIDMPEPSNYAVLAVKTEPKRLPASGDIA